ncbi:FAD-dependent oxidoreductase [Thalassomonas sp. M1454]|uniref:FAD-dependent oxidoreductase n=1 Tax=Thalassomonas sp. M1454 TaxID=2594477 RepID=UPI00117C98A2|nr:FAD-dependent oxidoreductase [Thalassomonas sp. M1454]TRX52686.1 FAD-dependent oxidoreductase [Thalassomonas sp. M1454]
MNRREFIRIIGGTVAVTAIAPTYGFANSGFSSSGMLIEAANFNNLGGWVLDTQFYQQMGGVQLLAHGLGSPVENASTQIDVIDSGLWNVYVRTTDWCPGDWEAPGQFKVHIDNKTLENNLGTQKGWGWQLAGQVELNKGQSKIEVEDLTGFEGRFDAIYLTKESSPKLPNTPTDLFHWKDQLTGRSKLAIEEKVFDFVVCGGGVTGCAAAIAADSQNINVAVIQDRPIFGGNASEEIRVTCIGITGKNDKLIKSVGTEEWKLGSEESIVDQQKREKTMADSNVSLFAGHMLIGLEKQGDKIVSVDARNITTGIITRLRSKQFLDSTGNGALGVLAGAKYRYGREASSEFNESWDKHGDLWSPEKPDNKVMGATIMWKSNRSKQAEIFPKVPWAMDVAGKDAATRGGWKWEYSSDELDQVADGETIRDHLFRAIYGNFYNAKKHPKHRKTKINFLGYILGRRESVRLMGDHIFTLNDAVDKPDFPDIVAEEKRVFDIHYQEKEKGHHADYRSEGLFKYVGLYYIPFRSLFSKNIDNLLIAGRNFSCSHIGLAGPRVMNTCAQMGVATGYAAALCTKYNANPRKVGQQHITELRKLIGYV